MNLLLLEESELGPEGRVVLTDRRARHLLRVLRVAPGRGLRAGLLGRGTATATVVSADRESVELDVALDGPPLPRRWAVDLVVGLPRPQALHRLLQVAAGMEVGTLRLTRSWRVEKSYFHSPSLEPERIRRQLVLGAEQGSTVHLPEVAIHHRFTECLEALGPPGADRRFVADPEALHPLPDELGAGEPVTFALGPEGGWIDRELESLAELGFRPFALGPWILKVEMAATAALAQLHRLRSPDHGACKGEAGAP